MVAERKIRWFFKIILSFNIELGMLRLPLKFVRSHTGQLATTAKLTTPDKRVWEMKVVRDGDHIWLKDGFGEFSVYYSLKEGHQVHFQHKSDSNFSIRIFDKSCCEIPYPSRANATPKPKPKPKPKKQDLYEYQSESRFKSPRHFNSTHSHFEVKLKAYNSLLNVMYVPPDFSKKHFVGTQVEDVKLETGDGRHWIVALKRKNSGRFNFGKGWNRFSEDNRLKENDVCIFELSQKKKSVSVFKVHIFVAVKKIETVSSKKSLSSVV